MFNEFIEKAITVIKAVPGPYQGNRYYLRNRIADFSLYLAEKSIRFESEFFDYCKPDIAECQWRADHYGVRIGEPTGKRIRHRRKDYDQQMAKYKKLILKSIDMSTLPDL